MSTDNSRPTVLAIDTSGPVAGCAVLAGGRIVHLTAMNHGLTHSETIMPAVDAALDAAGLRCGDVDVFAAVAGPGSFTGVRIGVCAVKALCLAAGRPCARVDALEAIAEGAAYEGLICPILDARRDQVYTALFRREGGKLSRVCEDRAEKLDELLNSLPADETVYFTGDGLNTYEGRIRGRMGERALSAPMHLRVLRASAACLIAMTRPETIMDGSHLTPAYLRLPQAERERNERLGKSAP
jgi:tRNA threonylcarbamoyladenosine biosynthesis protein TsaB